LSTPSIRGGAVVIWAWATGKSAANVVENKRVKSAVCTRVCTIRKVLCIGAGYFVAVISYPANLIKNGEPAIAWISFARRA
jgi:hypothetical protein